MRNRRRGGRLSWLQKKLISSGSEPTWEPKASICISTGAASFTMLGGGEIRSLVKELASLPAWHQFRSAGMPKPHGWLGHGKTNPVGLSTERERHRGS